MIVSRVLCIVHIYVCIRISVLSRLGLPACLFMKISNLSLKKGHIVYWSCVEVGFLTSLNMNYQKSHSEMAPDEMINGAMLRHLPI